MAKPEVRPGDMFYWMRLDDSIQAYRCVRPDTKRAGHWILVGPDGEETSRPERWCRMQPRTVEEAIRKRIQHLNTYLSTVDKKASRNQGPLQRTHERLRALRLRLQGHAEPPSLDAATNSL